ncbi:MAG: hypothetical protein V7603_3312 [Micromonosporaceae bacterium]|jgi:hypothetical protein
MQPPPPGPYPGAAPANDRTTLFGVLGIIIGLICCWPAGIVLGVLSIQRAKQSGQAPTLGYLAIGASVLGVIWNILYFTVIRK